MADSDLYDVTILGAGPVGLFGCFYAGMREMRTKVLDSLAQPGGQLMALYPKKIIYDMPGFPRIQARNLVARLMKQCQRFHPCFAMEQIVQSLQPQSDGTILLRTLNANHLSRAVVICTGAGAFSPKKLTAPGVEELEGRGIEYAVRNRRAYAGKRVAIIGGGDSALDWAIDLEPIAQSVTLIHRRDVFRAHEESVGWLLNRSHVDVRTFREVTRAEGEGHLERLVLANSQTGSEEVIPIDACVVSIGFAATLSPMRTWGLDLVGDAISVDHQMRTNIAGVYAAGDAITYDGKLKLIATGVGEVCTAVNFARTYIDPTARAFPGHSSNAAF